MSSAKAHFDGVDDGLVQVRPMLDRVSNWTDLLTRDDAELYDDVRLYERTVRLLGQTCFIEMVSLLPGRDLEKNKPEHKRK